MAGKDFEAFKVRIENEFMQHLVCTNNEYTAWFAQADLPLEHIKHFAVQFSVFSNLFCLAALNRVINAGTLASARESKEILMNELGVIYTKGTPAPNGTPVASLTEDQKDREGDPAIVSTEGTVNGGKFLFNAAHFEWLLRFGKPLGLGFLDMGKRRHGTKSTLHFCDELFKLYGSADYNEAMGAAFAVENWAAAGFWKELIAGLEKVKVEKVPDLPLAFFNWHDKIEEQHKAHVWEELKECFEHDSFDEDAFMRVGVEMLDGVKVFWDGLDADRKELEVASA